MYPKRGPKSFEATPRHEHHCYHGNNSSIRATSDGLRTRSVENKVSHSLTSHHRLTTYTIVLARSLIRVARLQEQESSADETPVCDERERAEPVDVPDTAEDIGPDGETQANDEAGGDGEHDRDGATTGDAVALDVFEVLAVHGGGEDRDGELDCQFSGFADFGGIAA